MLVKNRPDYTFYPRIRREYPKGDTEGIIRVLRARLERLHGMEDVPDWSWEGWERRVRRTLRQYQPWEAAVLAAEGILPPYLHLCPIWAKERVLRTR